MSEINTTLMESFNTENLNQLNKFIVRTPLQHEQLNKHFYFGQFIMTHCLNVKRQQNFHWPGYSGSLLGSSPEISIINYHISWKTSTRAVKDILVRYLYKMHISINMHFL